MAWPWLASTRPSYAPARTACDAMADLEQPCQQATNESSPYKSVAARVLMICVLALAAAGVLLWSSGALAPNYSVINLQHDSSSSSDNFIDEHMAVEPAADPQRSTNNSVAVSSSTAVLEYFPQANRCGNRAWMDAYSQLHQDITSGKLPPRYLISVAVQTGMADRITGLITQFYVALLSQRALTTVTYGKLAEFSAVCDMHNIQLGHPHQLPEDVIEPLMLTMSSRYRTKGITLPPSVNTSQYHPVYTVNYEYPDMGGFVTSRNFSNFPSDNPAVENVLWESNRGGTYALMHNSYHRAQLWGYGLTPETAFMCGFFYLCQPNNAVRMLYQHYWQALSVPGTLKIGIQVRFGDVAFGDGLEGGQKALLRKARAFFDCATQLEKAYAVPGQQVVWYLISDSLELCQAARQKYGDKVITETKVKPMHVDCVQHGGHNPDACSPEAINLAMQHALGQVLTFSKADYHVVTKKSGFGRLGAWMSGKFDNMYEIHVTRHQNALQTCNPLEPVRPSESSSHDSMI